VNTALEPWQGELLAAIPLHLRKRRLFLGLSGGLDSTLLLHGLVALRQAGHIDALQAVHVHHGLQAEADVWAERAQQLGNCLSVTVNVVRVCVNLAAKQGVEAAAREARYAAFYKLMQPGDVLLTGHHLDDQAETFILQLMRGAGVRGLSAMPLLQPVFLPEGEAWHLRPLLSTSRDTLYQHASQQGLDWVDDPSNTDIRLARNLVRHKVLPRLQQHWPQAVQTLARCAQRMASTESLLLDLARHDLEEARGEDVRCLSVDALRRLSVPRRENAVRGWLLELGLPSPPAARLHELGRVLDARTDALPKLAWPGAVLQRWRGGLYVVPDEVEAAVPWPGCDWSLQQPLELPDLSLRLVASHEHGRGLKPELLRHGVRVCVRHEASLPPLASRTTLAKRLQELGVPPWLRGHLPLLYTGDKLIQISELWVCPACRAQDHELGTVISIEHLPCCVT
jgi:tRNA(Ile)-lysidine synthase